MRFIVIVTLSLPFALSGCGLNDWANAHMPVIGERCENWQCFTESGREQSKLNQQVRLHAASPATASDGSRKPANADVGPTSAASGNVGAMPGAQTLPPAPASPTEPLAPPAPPEGAYKYFPRAPLPPGASPFDGQIATVPQN